jgi:hypothetical protein
MGALAAASSSALQGRISAGRPTDGRAPHAACTSRQRRGWRHLPHKPLQLALEFGERQFSQDLLLEAVHGISGLG